MYIYIIEINNILAKLYNKKLKLVKKYLINLFQLKQKSYIKNKYKIIFKNRLITIKLL